jgi:hypothetical protein
LATGPHHRESILSAYPYLKEADIDEASRYGQFVMPRIVTKKKKEQGSTTENTGIGIVRPTGEMNRVLHYRTFVEGRERAFRTRIALANPNLPK